MTEIRNCESCGKEFDALGDWQLICKLCYHCYHQAKKAEAREAKKLKEETPATLDDIEAAIIRVAASIDKLTIALGKLS